MADEVKFSKGPSSSLPPDKVPGRILIETDTGKMHLDVDSDTRIDIGGSSGGAPVLKETTITVDLSSDTSQKFDGTKDVDLGVKNILPTKHGGLGNDKGYVQTGNCEGIVPGNCATIEGQNNIGVGDCSSVSGQSNVSCGDNSYVWGQCNCAGGERLVLVLMNSDSPISVPVDNKLNLTGMGVDPVPELKVGDIISGLFSVGTSTDDVKDQVFLTIKIDEVSGQGTASSQYKISSTILPASENLEYGVIGCIVLSDTLGTPLTLVTSDSPCNSASAGGYRCFAVGDYATAEGCQCFANGLNASAKGYKCSAVGPYSFAVGYDTDSRDYQYTCGRTSTFKGLSGDHPTSESDMSGTIFKIGNGTPDGGSNAFRVATSGAVYGNGAYNSSGADYAEMFEWIDGNPGNEDRRGLFVTLDGEKIKIAQSGEYILGVISSTPAIVGDSYFGDNWHNMYQRDVFNQIVKYESDGAALLNQSNDSDSYEYKLNASYDPEQTYIPRGERPEWACVGMLGKLIVIDDGTCQVNEYCTCGPNGIATKSDSGYRVMARVDETHVKILLRNSR